MALYRIADLIIEIIPKYPFTASLCQPYLIESGEPDMRVQVSEQEIDAEQSADAPGSRGYLESLAIYRKIAEHLADFDGFLAHGAVIAAGDRAYMFCAPSGTGKTTHIRLWQQTYPHTVIINGDKPIIRRRGDEWIAYGTPWAGKERLQTNLGLPLHGICMLSRDTCNHIALIKPDQRLTAIARHVYFPHDARAAKTVALLAVLGSAVPTYALGCTPTPEAAHLSYITMTKENT